MDVIKNGTNIMVVSGLRLWHIIEFY